MEKVKVLFVCMGNICRSPLAHGLFESKVRERGLEGWIVVDSAGTHAYHVGEAPDPRSQEVARRHGIDLSGQRARQALREDFERYDYILAMDRDNYFNLKQIQTEGSRARLELFLSFAPELRLSEVPDPYYGGDEGFDRVYDMVDAAADGLLDAIVAKRC